jgi:hypothetical protein
MDQDSAPPRLCPLCKEAIHPEAIKCKHCGSLIGGPGADPARRLNMLRSPIHTRAGNTLRTAVASDKAFGEVCGPPEITVLDTGVYLIIFEDAYCCTPQEIVGDNGQVTVQQVCYWKPVRDPIVIWHEPGEMAPVFIGDPLKPFLD